MCASGLVCAARALRARFSAPFGVENLAALRAATTGSGGHGGLQRAGVTCPAKRLGSSRLGQRRGSVPLSVATISRRGSAGRALAGSLVEQIPETLGPRRCLQLALLAFEPESSILRVSTVHGQGHALRAGLRSSVFRCGEFPPSGVAVWCGRIPHNDLRVCLLQAVAAMQ
jgi:hypothetical protein